MVLPPGPLGLSDTALPLVRDLIVEQLGIHYDDARLESLRDRVAPLVVERGFGSFLDYYYLLKYDPEARGEWARVMDALSVPETYFWRELDQLRAVADVIVPGLAAERRAAPIRIWSVPCATGEEPLTLAMLLEERGWFDRVPIEIHAADASPAAIERARTRRFRGRSFRALPAAIKAKYFTECGDGWEVNERLFARVTSWRVLNLVDAAQNAVLAGTQIVLCRNVLIYFSEPAIRRLVERLAALLSVPAYLCIGASESLLKLQTAFELEEIGGAFVYVKKN
jgi:chemotaxis protein methyltransferase CheR